MPIAFRLRFDLLLAYGAMAGWVLYFIFAPTLGFGLLDSWHNEQRLIQIGLLLFSCLATILLLWKRRLVGVETFSPWLLVILAMGGLSAWRSNFRTYAYAEVSLCVALSSLALCAAVVVKERRELATRVFFGSAWLIGLIYIVSVASNYLAAWGLNNPIDVDAFILGYANPRFASTMHALILPLIAVLIFHQRRTVRYSSVAIASLLWAINIALGTRAIWVAFVLSLAAYWAIGNDDKRVVKALIATAAAGVLIYGVVLYVAPDLLPQKGSMQSRIGAMGDDRGRFELWVAALNQIIGHPLLGAGPMQFATLRHLDGAHPHNWALQFAAEWGLPVLALVCVGIIVWVRRIKAALMSIDQRSSEGLLPALVVSVLTAFVYGMVDGIWVMPVSQSLASLYLGATLGLSSPSNESLVPIYRVVGTGIVSFVASAFLLYFLAQTLPELKSNEAEYVRESGMQYFYPRFWQQGLLLESATPSDKDQ